ncbi:MAG: family 1 glycosylhydrolase, partial [Pseudomonadota bacterium]
ERGLKPAATLYHWELPSALADLGGWRNRDIAGWFGDFTEVIMGRIGTPKIWGRGALAGIAVGLFIVVQLGLWVDKAFDVPAIHDITTDTDDPPEFVAVAPLRADAANPAEYAGEEAAEQQRGAYPDLATLELAASPATVIAAAEQIARSSGWEIVAAAPADGRLEATDTTFWYGYKDDIVVRATSEGSISMVDVRSKSRVGRSDLGTNAERIRTFTAELKAALGE